MGSHEGDVHFVQNLTPVHRDTAELELVQTWGKLEGSVDEVFTDITAFDVTLDGRVYVHDLGRGIRWFESDGRFGGILARPGQGPGEVRHAPVVRISPTGQVVAWDVSNQKIMVFDDRHAVETFRAPLRWPYYDESAISWDADGDPWAKLIRGSDETGLLYPRPEYSRMLAGELVDTLWIEGHRLDRCTIPYDATYRAGFWDDKRIPWLPSVMSALDSTGLAWACSADASFQVASNVGDTLVVSWPAQSLPISEEEKEFWALSPPMPELPDVRPIIARLIRSEDGRTWIWPAQLPTEWTPSPELQAASGVSTALRFGQSGAFEVFARDGRWLGAVALPEEIRYDGYPTTPRIRIRGDTLWAVRSDEFDVETIGRYHVVWPD